MEITRPQGLSDMEFAVFKGLVEGTPIKDIASAKCLSPSTISTYRARILKKLNLKYNADLVRLAHRVK
jgi:two-component system invasion response regulator UvrY